jgi:hypothetical protein
VIGLLGVFSMGHEYRHGMIRATLTALLDPWGGLERALGSPC